MQQTRKGDFDLRTLIVPCGGKSSRFPNMRPKYLLTYPDGSLMGVKAISGLNLDSFDRIIYTVVKDHCKEYEADIILNQALDTEHNNKIEICILPEFTKCQSETVFQTIKTMNVEGQIVIKDSDNYIEMPAIPEGNFIAGLNVNRFNKEVFRLGSKSFLIVNNQNVVVDIVEKKIKSEYISTGLYGFASAQDFVDNYSRLKENGNIDTEIYISHVISFMIGMSKWVFKYEEIKDFEDWGTLRDWQIVANKMKTYFVDIDGVIFQNRGKYGTKNWSNSAEPIKDNVEMLKELYDGGAQIVITTSRGREYEPQIREFFEANGIHVHSIVTECNHAPRVIINDFAPSNPYPSCIAISIPRNEQIRRYLS